MQTLGLPQNSDSLAENYGKKVGLLYVLRATYEVLEPVCLTRKAKQGIQFEYYDSCFRASLNDTEGKTRRKETR